ncbi:MAG: periplasmic heavy metal sensor [bacterium]
MNYKRLTLLLAGVLVTLVALLLIRPMMECTVPSIESINDSRWLKKTLKLTPAQAAEIQSLHQELGKTLAGCCGRHCRARASLMEALFASTNGLERSQALIDEMCRAQAASELATLTNIYRVREVLTPKQRELYERQVKSMDCMSGTAGGGATCGCMGK